MAKKKARHGRAGKNDANPALPEDGGAAAAASAELPFSDMIARWLDDGDKLHERVHEPSEFTTEVAGHEGRVRIFIENARTHARRHRRVISGAALLAVIVSLVAFRRAHLGDARGGEMVSVESTAAPTAVVAAPPVAVAATPPVAVAATPVTAAVPPVTVDKAPAVATAPKAIVPPEPPAAKVAADPVMPATPASTPPTAGATLASTAVVAAMPHKPRAADAPALGASSPLEACKAALIHQRSRDALSACSQVFGGDPRSADNMVLLARADLLAGRTSETLTLARRAVAANPRQADAYLLIGTIQQTTGQRGEARIAYETYLQLSPYGAHASDVRAILRTL
jgi:hypothetical protein